MKNAKIFVLGLVAGIILAGLTVFASTNLEVIMNYAKVQVAGQDVQSDNFYVDGKTYVWIRDVADLFGKDIDWNEETKTANIVEKGTVAQQPEAYVPIETDDNVALSVDDVKVTMQEIKALAYSNLMNVGDTAAALKTAQEDAMNTAIAVNAAQKDGVLMPETVRQQLQATVNSYLTGTQSKDFIEFLAQNALTADLYVDIMAKMQYEGIYAQDLKSRNLIPEKEIQDYFDQHKSDFEQVTAKHILIQEKDGVDAKQVATDLYKRLLNGADFDQMMKEKSEDTGLAQNPDGYTFTRGQMVKEFEDAAFTQTVKKLYPPVKSQYGYHIIYVTERAVPTFEENKSACVDKMFTDWYQNYLKGLSKDMKVTVDQESIDKITLE